MSRADIHQHGCLVQCHVLSEQTVQDLQSGLFFWVQGHILHTVNMTFMLAIQRGPFRWTTTPQWYVLPPPLTHFARFDGIRYYAGAFKN